MEGVLGTQTRCSRIEGADESTELWRHPIIVVLEVHSESNLTSTTQDKTITVAQC